MISYPSPIHAHSHIELTEGHPHGPKLGSGHGQPGKIAGKARAYILFTDISLANERRGPGIVLVVCIRALQNKRLGAVAFCGRYLAKKGPLENRLASHRLIQVSSCGPEWLTGESARARFGSLVNAALRF